MFQSHYGAIATYPRCLLSLSDMNRFNPTMVRLRRDMERLIVALIIAFQSHYGAIATNSLYGKWGAMARVSIPLWCDCDDSQRAPYTTTWPVSIPLWCDCDQIGVPHFFGGPPTMFQSHYGAIATGRWVKFYVKSELVSIPLWCDCDPLCLCPCPV